MSMQVTMHTLLRGQREELVWCDGALTGNEELVDRFHRMSESRPTDLSDPVAVLESLEQMLGQRPDVDAISM